MQLLSSIADLKDIVNKEYIDSILADYVLSANLGALATKDSLAFSDLTSRPSKLSDFTDDVVAGKYLPLSGGTVTGTIEFTASTPALKFYRDYGNVPYIHFGASPTSGYGEVGADKNGNLVFWSLVSENSAHNAWNTVLHAKNIGEYALPISGGTITGNGANLLAVNRQDGNPVIEFRYNGSIMGRYGFATDGTPISVVMGSQVTLLHSGNVGDYALPSSGGTISGLLTLEPQNYHVIDIVSPDPNLAQITMSTNDILRGILQYNSNYGFGFHHLGLGGIYVNLGGEPNFVDSANNKHTLIHSGNYSSYALPLSGGTIRGTVAISGNHITNAPLNIVSPSMGYTGYIRFGAGIDTNELGLLGFSAKGVPAMVYEGQVNTLVHSGNVGDYALPSSGGTISGDTDALKILRNTNGYSAITYYNTQNGATTLLGVMGFDSNGEPSAYRASDNAWRTLIHSGNVGEYNAGGIIGKLWSAKTTPNLLTVWHDWNNKAEIGYSSYSYGLHSVSTDANYQFLLGADALIDGLFFKRKTADGWGNWKTVAFTDSNVASADYASNAGTLGGVSLNNGSDTPWGTIPMITEGGYMDVGKHFEFHYDNTTGSDYSTVLSCAGNYGNFVWLPSASGTLALTTDNVASANVLSTSYSENINYSSYTSQLKLIRSTDGNAVANGFPFDYVSGLSVMAGYVGWQMVIYGDWASNPNPRFRSVGGAGDWSPWKTIAFTDSNVASATRAKYIETLNYTGAGWYGDSYKLYAKWFNGTICDWKSTDDANNEYKVRVDIAKKLDTARTLWGQSFDGTGNITGNLTLGNRVSLCVTDNSGTAIDAMYITATNHLVFGTGAHSIGGYTFIGGDNLFLRYGSPSPTIGVVLNQHGNVTIGGSDALGTSATTKLYVDGGIRFSPRKIWGQSFDGTADVAAQLTFKANDAALSAWKKDGSSTSIFLQVNPDRHLLIGQGTARENGGLYLYGNDIRMCYGNAGSSSNTAMLINASGNVTIGSSDTAGADYKLRVDGESRFTDRVSVASLRIVSVNGSYAADFAIDGSSLTLNRELKFTNVTASDICSGIAASFKTSLAQAESLIARNIILGASSGSASNLALSFQKYTSISNTAPNGLTTLMTLTTDGNLGIGTTNPQYKLDVAGSIRTTSSLTIGTIVLTDENGTLKIAGNAYTTGQLGAGEAGQPTSGGGSGQYWSNEYDMDIGTDILVSSKEYIGTNTIVGWDLAGSCLNDLYIGYDGYTIWMQGSVDEASDMRLKTVIDAVNLDIRDIAYAPIFNYVFKSRPQGRQMLGSSAQYWQAITPKAVSENDKGNLAMNYGAIALASVVAVAKKVVTHEEEIAELKSKVQSLETRLAKYELN